VNTQQFLEQLKSSGEIIFSDFTDLIDSEYIFLPTAFTNGDLVNKEDENQGSAKVFCFGSMHELSEYEVLRCFGEHYQSVLNSLVDGTSHLNIRSFMRRGWKGVSINAEALIKK
jgi:histidinol phosphatase-like PHP family hydrolase